MKKGNVLLVVALILIAGLIVAISVYFTRNMSQKTEGGTGKTTPPVTQTAREKLEATFDKGLSWWMKQQLENGAWPNPNPDPSGKADVAFTAMTLITVGKAPQKYQDTYKTQVEKGVQYLLSHLQPDGAIIDDPNKIPTYTIYKTSLAVSALAALGKEKYKDTIDKAVKYLRVSQYGPEDGDSNSGSWGNYGDKPGAPKQGNLSMTEYALTALRDAGIPEDSDTWKRAVEFLDKTQSSSENKYRASSKDGGFVYSPVESKSEVPEKTLPDGTKILRSYASMTYAGLLSFIYSYVKKDDPRVLAAYNWIRQHYSLEENIGLRTDTKPQLGKQGLYYYYHTFAKALNAYKEQTIETLPDKTVHYWANDLVEKLASLQKPDGFWVNEFEERWFEGYNGLATAYSLMALNLCREWVK